MSVETALRDALASNHDGEEFARQIKDFREFEKKLNQAGYEIPRETFSIPLMGRVTSGRHTL